MTFIEISDDPDGTIGLMEDILSNYMMSIALLFLRVVITCMSVLYTVGEFILGWTVFFFLVSIGWGSSYVFRNYRSNRSILFRLLDIGRSRSYGIFSNYRTGYFSCRGAVHSGSSTRTERV
ncbi:uncharacterized protein LOC143202628 [Rhynchophorus ferrugineus]|uniref:uncharacterized protein LOC143202628 n=1 Tax=Rhynchophorus ferrugineus TaxID=354439 RepID=UPI003FCC5858